MPGIVQPAIECPTRTMSASPAASTSAATEAAQSAKVTESRATGCAPRPGMPTAMAGAVRAGSSRSQHDAAKPPP
jgi:hypothetical protein